MTDINSFRWTNNSPAKKIDITQSFFFLSIPKNWLTNAKDKICEANGNKVEDSSVSCEVLDSSAKKMEENPKLNQIEQNGIFSFIFF